MFSTWRRKHHLPLRLESEFQAVLQEQWAKRITCLHADPRLTWKDVSVARALLRKDFVVRCEDHEPNHLKSSALVSTFNLPSEPGKTLKCLNQCQVLGINGTNGFWTRSQADCVAATSGGSMPMAPSQLGSYFEKRKKSFLKGRTIISYCNSCIKELLKAASQAILLMIRLVWPEAMGMATTPQLWQSLHDFLQRTRPTIHLAEVNDDLVGFFNSVPRQQILDSLSRLVTLYQERDFLRRVS